MASKQVRFRAFLIAAGFGAVLLGAGVARAMVGVADQDGARSASTSGAAAEVTPVFRGVSQVITSPDVPLPPGEYALKAESAPVGDPSVVLAAAAKQYPGFVTDRSIARFLAIGNDTPNNHRDPVPTWVIVTPDVYAPLFGLAKRQPETRMAASYAWVFLDPDGTVVGATIIGYRNAGDAPPLPAE